MRIILNILLLAVLSSCSPFVFKSGTDIQTLSIYLEFHPDIPVEIEAMMNQQMDDLIMSYNARNNKFKIERSDELPDENALRIRVHTSKLVTPNQNAAGVAVTALGLATPFIMAAAGSDFIIAFWYFPKTTSIIEWQLSPDVDGMKVSPYMEPLRSPGFLKSPENQVKKHGMVFSKVLNQKLKQLEKSLK